MRMEDHRHRRARARRGGETAFETAFGAGKDDFGHNTRWLGAVARGRRLIIEIDNASASRVSRDNSRHTALTRAPSPSLVLRPTLMRMTSTRAETRHPTPKPDEGTGG